MLGAVLGGVALATLGAASTVGAELLLKKGIEDAIEKRHESDDEEDEDDE